MNSVIPPHTSTVDEFHTVLNQLQLIVALVFILTTCGYIQHYICSHTTTLQKLAMSLYKCTCAKPTNYTSFCFCCWVGDSLRIPTSWPSWAQPTGSRQEYLWGEGGGGSRYTLRFLAIVGYTYYYYNTLWNCNCHCWSNTHLMLCAKPMESQRVFQAGMLYKLRSTSVCCQQGISSSHSTQTYIYIIRTLCLPSIWQRVLGND